MLKEDLSRLRSTESGMIIILSIVESSLHVRIQVSESYKD